VIADMAGHLAPALTSEQALQRATTPADGLLALLIVDPVNSPRSSAAYVPPREKSRGCGTPRARAVAVLDVSGSTFDAGMDAFHMDNCHRCKESILAPSCGSSISCSRQDRLCQRT
jgi:hypothetical protein